MVWDGRLKMEDGCCQIKPTREPTEATLVGRTADCPADLLTYGVLNVAYGIQSPGPLAPVVRMRQYSGLCAGRLMVGV